MITKEQALTCDRFHYGTCMRMIGPRGGVVESTQHWRRNGQTQTWVTRPDDFRIPVKYGLKSCGQITHTDAHMFHTAEDCPLNNPAYVTKDMRTPLTSPSKDETPDIGCRENTNMSQETFHRTSSGTESTNARYVWE